MRLDFVHVVRNLKKQKAMLQDCCDCCVSIPTIRIPFQRTYLEGDLKRCLENYCRNRETRSQVRKNRKTVVSKIPKKVIQKQQSPKNYIKISLKNLKEVCKCLHDRETQFWGQGHELSQEIQIGNQGEELEQANTN